MKTPKQPEAAKKADHLKTKEELMEELLYLRAEIVWTMRRWKVSLER